MVYIPYLTGITFLDRLDRFLAFRQVLKGIYFTYCTPVVCVLKFKLFNIRENKFDILKYRWKQY